MSQREKIIAGILAVCTVLVLTIANPFSAKNTEKKSSAPVPLGVSLQKSPSAPASVSRQDMEALLEKLSLNDQDSKVDEIRNPFQKFDLKISGKTELEYSDLVLTGIMKGREPVAVINNQIHKVGDKIVNFEIQSIGSNEVVVTRGTEKYVLKLFLEP